MTDRTAIPPIVDRVPRDAPGTVEIGFSVPERYNAGAVLFDNLVQGRGERIALRGPTGDRSYDVLCAAAARAGNALLAQGLSRGERLLLLLDDTPAYPAFLFGALRAGLVPVLVNTLTPPDLLRFYLEDSGARAIVLDAAFAGQLTEAAAAGTRLETAFLVNGTAGLPPRLRAIDGDNGLAGLPERLEAADTHRDDMAFWMYSSGSTGRPKGIVHLHHDLPYTAASYARHILALTAEDVCFSVPKIFFAYGFGNSLTFPFSVGASSLLLPGRPEPGAIFRAIAQYRPTVFFGLPTLYTAIAASPEAKGADFSSLRLSISAAEVLSDEVAAAWRRLAGHDIIEGLGSTEMLHIYLSNRPGRRKAGAAGMRVPGYELKLLDGEGWPVEDGAEGFLWVRGDSSAPCYWNRPDKTAETMREGWLHTGDRFLRDADGFYFFRGRADDLVKVSGQWVHPLEVELCLANHEAVREAAVLAVALPDRRMTIKAFIVPADPAADRAALTRALQDYVKRTLLPYKYPRTVEYLAELPKTGTGKIDRHALRAMG